MKIEINLKDIWLVLTHPCWMRAYPYSKHYDDWLVEQLKDPKFEYQSDRIILLNGVPLWVANKFISYGQIYGYNMLPKRSTQIKLFQLADKFMVEYHTNPKSAQDE